MTNGLQKLKNVADREKRFDLFYWIEYSEGGHRPTKLIPDNNHAVQQWKQLRKSRVTKYDMDVLLSLNGNPNTIQYNNHQYAEI